MHPSVIYSGKKQKQPKCLIIGLSTWRYIHIWKVWSLKTFKDRETVPNIRFIAEIIFASSRECISTGRRYILEVVYI